MSVLLRQMDLKPGHVYWSADWLSVLLAFTTYPIIQLRHVTDCGWSPYSGLVRDTMKISSQRLQIQFAEKHWIQTFRQTLCVYCSFLSLLNHRCPGGSQVEVSCVSLNELLLLLFSCLSCLLSNQGEKRICRLYVSHRCLTLFYQLDIRCKPSFTSVAADETVTTGGGLRWGDKWLHTHTHTHIYTPVESWYIVIEGRAFLDLIKQKCLPQL